MLPDSLPDAGVLVRCSHTAMLHVTLAHVMRRTVEAPRLPAPRSGRESLTKQTRYTR